MATQAVEFVVPLRSNMDATSVGAKAANLGRVMDLGLSVSGGVALSRNALRLFLKENDLTQRAQRLMDNEIDEASRAVEYKALCTAVLKAPIPRQVMEAAAPIVQTLLADSPSGIAVRSSGMHEDLEKASFAGVYESFLGIRTERDLWLAVRRCWCALWVPHAVDYALRMGIRPEVDGMGVLLQSLVAADSAGVLFTADPRTGNPWRFVLESTWGLARDLVGSAGATPADRFLCEWDSGAILSRDIGRKKTALVPGARGIDIVDIPAEQQALPSLTDDLASRIAQAGLQIDRAFGVRVDVEWAVEADTVHIVQARPLTALPEFFPHHLPPHLKDQTWRRPGLWYFMLRNVDGSVILPIYRDKLITEWYNRYLQVGCMETPVSRKSGVEQDFHGHRYLAEAHATWPWPHVPFSEREQFLIEHEPQMRADFLHNSRTRVPATEQRALRLENESNTLELAIDAILWVREEMWDLGAFFVAGPAQHLAYRCRELLSAFVDEHLPNTDLNDLLSGHHPELDPYQPHVMIAEAERVAQLLEPERDRFQELSLDEWIRTLEAGDAPSSFMAAFEESCDRFALVPPWRFRSIAASLRWHSIQYLRLLRSALKGGPRIAQAVEEMTLRREAMVAEARQALAACKPDELPHFERLHDWALFWGPALNHRILRADVPGRRLMRLFGKMREILLAAGLVLCQVSIEG